ncbi:MAG: hypothetical protein HY854_19180 [Burkholderiales bacterium]|nr:hypothetical protein [Burkholderiales bacterium]
MIVSAFTLEQKRAWAQLLAPWSATEVSKLDAQGLAGSAVAANFVAEAEKQGHVWPVRYGK